ncbi:MAG: hypothetical protein ACI936_002669 [Paraglaciecola sp.]|jgi:hypothetical protein
MIKPICRLLKQLIDLDGVSTKETLSNCVYETKWNREIQKIVVELATLAQDNNFTTSFNFNIDKEHYNTAEFLNKYDRENAEAWDIIIAFDKDKFIQSVAPQEVVGSKLILFTTVEEFIKHNTVSDSLGLKNPFKNGAINHNKSTVLWVYGLGHNDIFGGSKLAVLPAGEVPENSLWSQSSQLPYDERLQKSIFIVADDSFNIRPLNFELSWGDTDNSLAKPFRVASAKVLLACTAQHFFSQEKIVLHGIKHIELSLNSDGVDITTAQVNEVKKAIDWCYKDEDSDTKLQLLADRLSLDIKNDGNLFSSGIQHITSAFEQAKSKYSFVISERNNDYRKELKEVYQDIQQFSADYSNSAIELSSGFIKDLLSIAFIFTVGSVAKAIVYKTLLSSSEASTFFKVIGVYFVFSFVTRCMHANSALEQTSTLLEQWSLKLRTHIAESEIKQLIESSIKKPKSHYETTRCFIGTCHFFLVLICFNSANVLKSLGL